MNKILSYWNQGWSFIFTDNKKFESLLQNLYYFMHINLYGCLFSDHDCDWVYPNLSFEKENSYFVFALRYENGYLWLKIEKILGLNSGLSKNEIKWLKILNDLDFILVYTGKERRDNCEEHEESTEFSSDENIVQMEFKKWVGSLDLGSLDEGYMKLFDQIDWNFKKLVKFFGAKMPDFEDDREGGCMKNILEIGFLEKIKHFSNQENKEYTEEKICETYYRHGMNDFSWNKKYNYSDWNNLSQECINKQRILSMNIFNELNKLKIKDINDQLNLSRNLFVHLYELL
jgi:hypothetical protein